MLVPFGVLLLQAGAGDEREFLFRALTAERLGRTVGLGAVVVVLVSLLAVPAAWLVVRTQIPGARLLTALSILPLAVPGYVMATAAMDLGGYRGFLERTFGWQTGSVDGFGGAAAILTVYTYPYMFVSVRAALLGLDPAREEAARSLGAGRRRVFRSAVLPQLLPAWSAGGLLVGLHVIGDFGVASLMRFETLGVAVETAYASAMGSGAGRYAYAAGLSLILLVLSLTFVAGDFWLLRRHQAQREPARVRRRRPRTPLGAAALPAVLFLLVIPVLGVGVPLLMMFDWLGDPTPVAHGFGKVLGTVGNAVRVSLPAAVLAVLLVLPVILRASRTRRLGPRLLERSIYLGYATPRIVLGLAIYVAALALPDWVLPHPRQTTVLLVLAYAIHFMAEAIGPLRATLLQVSPRLEEAARSLGLTRTRAFARVTLPLLSRGIAGSLVFVFVACMKDLPLTLMLRPDGFDTPAWRVYSHATEAQFGSAAPYALAIVLTTAVFVVLVVRREDSRR